MKYILKFNYEFSAASIKNSHCSIWEEQGKRIRIRDHSEDREVIAYVGNDNARGDQPVEM